MQQNVSFLKMAAIAGMLTALTTFLLWLLPRCYPTPANFEEAVLLAGNKYYLTLKWVNFLHIPLALFAYAGLALLLYRQQPALGFFGMMWFGIWGIIEMIGMAITIFSVNFQWRAAYAGADLLQKATLKNNIDFFSSIWDSMFFVLLVAFLLATLFFAWASWQLKGLGKWLSYLLWLAVPLTVFILLHHYAAQQWAGSITAYVYPVLQPISRFVLGLFIWKQANEIQRAASS